MKKRIFLITIIGLFLMMLPLIAGGEIVDSGTCGENITWELDDAGNLSITGTGEMINETVYSLFPTDKVKKAVISNGITSVADYAFAGCENLLNVTLPNTLTRIGHDSFTLCHSLLRVILPSSIKTIDIGAFYQCYSLSSIIIPGSVSSLGRSCFAECTGLTSITIQNGVPEISEYMFGSCTSLTSITIPGSVKTIGENAFNYCTNLSEITLEPGIQTIGKNAFKECKCTTYVIPEGVTSIGDGAFSYWSTNGRFVLVFPDSLTSIGSGIANRNYSWGQVIIQANCGSYAQRWSKYAEWGTWAGTWSYHDYIFESLNHVESIVVTKNPTCSQTGLQNRVCSYCNTIIVQNEEIPIVDHDPVSDQNGYDPTCTETGLTDSYSCLYCSMEMIPQEEIPALGHDWDETVYSWSEDNSEVTASHICKRNNSHTEEETVTTTSQRTKEPSCTELGETTYYASFENELFMNQEKALENIDILGHAWEEPEYLWADDNSTLTARRTCARNTEHIEEETVEIISFEETTAPTCIDMGETTYTSNAFENEAFETQSRTLADIPALGHDWSNVQYVWAQDNGSLTAKRICTRDAEHIDSETVNVNSEETKAATCTEMGETTYTSNAFENDAFEIQSKTLVDIPALGHDWGTANYTWSSDNNRVTAVHYCNRVHSHLEIESVATTSTTTATCEEGGETIYTSNAFKNSSFEVQSKVIEGTPALGHDWENPTYTWSDDNGIVIAVRICSRNHNHSQDELVETTSEETKPATCLEMGETTYTTSAFENEAFAVQSKTVPDIPALGHEWGEIQYVWAEDNSTVTASRICSRDKAHIETETVETVETRSKEPTCEEAGLASYITIPFENEAFMEQFREEVELAALGHDWCEPIYVWNDSNSQVIATSVCSHDASHVETEIADTEMEIAQSPTDNESGVVTYLVSFESELFNTQEKNVDIPALKDMDVLKLPMQMNNIEDEAFSGIACEAIIIPEGCTTIGDRAFAGCTNLLYVKIPATVTSYPASAFEGCNENLVIDWEGH